MNLERVTYRYTFDKGLNLLQRKTASGQTRMVAATRSNRAVNSELYSSLGLSPVKKAGLGQAFIDNNIFDKGGNQLKSVVNAGLYWDYRSMLQSTTTVLKDQNGRTCGQLNEYNLYAKTGRRNRKISERTDAAGNIVEIREVLYLGNLEYRSTWTGGNLNYDGEVVRENNQAQTPQEAYVALRIRQGHKQVSEKRLYTVKDGVSVNELSSYFSLDNNLDSCELQLDNHGGLSAYFAGKPYGETAVSLGKNQKHPYKYSGQERDQSGSYYFGYRSLLPQNYRWMSADPSGKPGSGLNWYAMVQGNPVSLRDKMGLTIKVLKPDSNEVWLSALSKYLGEGYEFDDQNELQKPAQATMTGSSIFKQAVDRIIDSDSTLWLASASNVSKYSFSTTDGTYNNADFNLKKDTKGAVTGTYRDENQLENYVENEQFDTIIIIHPTYRVNLRDDNNRNLPTDLGDILMHEIYGHAYPLMFAHNEDFEMGKENAIARENDVREQMSFSLRRYERSGFSNHYVTTEDEQHIALNPQQASVMKFMNGNSNHRTIEDVYDVKPENRVALQPGNQGGGGCSCVLL